MTRALLATPAVPRRALLVAVLMGTAGCGLITQEKEQADPMELTSGEQIDQVIGAPWREGGERRLSEITGVEFDELLVFPEGTPSDRVNDAAGGRLLNGKYYQSSTQLFLFRSDGSAVLDSMVSSDVFEHEIQNATFGPDVRIVAPGGRQLVTLKD